MNISVFGLGYVGAVSAACLASTGHRVIGVDPQATKVDAINAGRAPLVERDLDRRIAAAQAQGLLSATTDAAEAISNSELALVCVGTPSQANGDLDLTYLRRVCADIGAALAERHDYFVVVVRSTLLPGTTDQVVIPMLESSSGKRCGTDFGVCVNPEFLREGSAVADFFAPPKVVMGGRDPRAIALATAIAEQPDAPLLHVDIPVAETVKYVDNAWHALKVSFANEVGVFAKHSGVDAHEIMDVFTQDTKLNLSPKYLRPGSAFGGSCLPKDVRALTYRARRHDLDLPVLGSVLASNDRHLERAVDMVTAHGYRKVGVIGLSFKPGTDDLRESPLVRIVEQLIGKGYDLRIVDPNVRLAQVSGANRDYLLNRLPHISNLLVDTVDEVVAHAETLVIGSDSDELQARLPLTTGDVQRVVDLVRVGGDIETQDFYDGICW